RQKNGGGGERILRQKDKMRVHRRRVCESRVGESLPLLLHHGLRHFGGEAGAFADVHVAAEDAGFFGAEGEFECFGGARWDLHVESEAAAVINRDVFVGFGGGRNGGDGEAGEVVLGNVHVGKHEDTFGAFIGHGYLQVEGLALSDVGGTVHGDGD